MMRLIWSLFACILSWSTANAEAIKLCMDERDWYPFTYKEEEKPKGMLVDIVQQAFKNQGLEISIETLPWLRCAQKEAEAGNVDGIFPASYNAALAQFLRYPEDAAKARESQTRLMQIDQAVITLAEDPYVFKGDLKSLPLPVRVPIGDPIIADLQAAQITPEPSRGDKNNLGKLLRDKNGALITTTIQAESFDRDPQMHGKLKIHAVPINSKSYFLAFSQKGKVTPEQAQKIWQEIAKWRDDYVYMLQLFAQY